MNQRISKNISLLNILMSCIIVLYHASTLGDPVIHIDACIDLYINDVLEDLSYVAMSFFFFMSGFLLFKNISFKNYLEKIQKRIFTLLIPYLLWQLFFAIIRLDILGQRRESINFLKTVFLFEQWPPDGPLWYLYIIFLLALLSPILILIYKNRRCGQAFILIVMLFSNYSLATGPLSNGNLSTTIIPNIIEYLPSYIMGTYFGFFHYRSMKLRDLSTTTILLVLSMIFNDDGSMANTALEGILKRTTLNIIPMLLVYTLPEIKKLDRLLETKFTFIMYAIHPVFVALIVPTVYSWVLNRFGLYFLANTASCIIVLGSSAAVSLTLHKLGTKYAPRTLNILTGGRC